MTCSVLIDKNYLQASSPWILNFMSDTFLFVSSDHGKQSEMENLMFDLDTIKESGNTVV